MVPLPLWYYHMNRNRFVKLLTPPIISASFIVCHAPSQRSTEQKSSTELKKKKIKKTWCRFVNVKLNPEKKKKKKIIVVVWCENFSSINLAKSWHQYFIHNDSTLVIFFLYTLSYFLRKFLFTKSRTLNVEISNRIICPIDY